MPTPYLIPSSICSPRTRYSLGPHVLLKLQWQWLPSDSAVIGLGVHERRSPSGKQEHWQRQGKHQPPRPDTDTRVLECWLPAPQHMKDLGFSSPLHHGHHVRTQGRGSYPFNRPWLISTWEQSPFLLHKILLSFSVQQRWQHQKWTYHASLRLVSSDNTCSIWLTCWNKTLRNKWKWLPTFY